MNKNIPPFYVGQRVVALNDATNNAGYSIKKGEEFTVKQIKSSCCRWIVDIGFETKVDGNICGACGKVYLSYGVVWCNARHFAPITSQFQSITLEKILEIETPLVGVQ